MVYIGIGSNIDAQANLKKCAVLLRQEWPDVSFAHVYRTQPMHRTDQDDFLNTAARFETAQSLISISETLHDIEKTLKKNPPHRFGPRTIDLDILLYDDDTIETENLTVPHPRMHERRFVLEPLCELLPENWKHPVWKKTCEGLLRGVQEQECLKTQMQP